MDALNVIIIILLLYYIYKNVRESFTSSFITSSVDKRKYKVVNSYNNKTEAADKMAEIHDFIIQFLKYMRNKYIINRNGNTNEIEFTIRMINNYNPDSIFENDPTDGKNTSYVVNKGEKFGICLREKAINDGNIHDMNTLKFVILHELTHLGCKSFGHDYEFWAFFKFNLINAYNAGIYYPINYNETPMNYCGLHVEFSPFYSNYYDWNNI